jgi:hypothetical protein
MLLIGAGSTFFTQSCGQIMVATIKGQHVNTVVAGRDLRHEWSCGGNSERIAWISHDTTSHEQGSVRIQRLRLTGFYGK